MIETKPLILITNDDSISAPGLLRLVDCVPEGTDIIVVAPAEPRSGQSSALTVGTPLRIKSVADYKTARMFTVNGTPVDCVKLAMDAIVPRRPDLVLAGINHGSNSGCNVLYSGTMGAVLEGCTLGITSCGFSLLHHSMQADFSMCLPFVKEIIAKLLESGLPKGV
ncbi:MAG: 5'/3'-nucleotidase SurE, partial [Muribaculaceae bacterium]|nr:5'/3'-nucleotidase SurE [Muribaculaceae bacterium]